jgi:uncharacterized protein (TIGR03435 family)
MRILLAILVSVAAFAQAPARLEFEVASIRPSQPPSSGGQVHVGVQIDGAQVRFIYASVQDLMAAAYSVKSYQIIAPDYVIGDRFDISAKLPEGATRSQVPAMLQSLLEDRFALKLHHESKDFPVYALIVNKGGLKMKETPPDAETDRANAAKGAVDVAANGGPRGVSVDFGHGSYFSMANDKLECKKISMPNLVNALSRFLERPIVDMTGLTGNYDLTIQFTPEDFRTLHLRSAITAGVQLPPEVRQMAEGGSFDSLFSGMLLLGLKLEQRKAPLDVLVVDHSEKTPIGN